MKGHIITIVYESTELTIVSGFVETENIYEAIGQAVMEKQDLGSIVLISSNPCNSNKETVTFVDALKRLK